MFLAMSGVQHACMKRWSPSDLPLSLSTSYVTLVQAHSGMLFTEHLRTRMEGKGRSFPLMFLPHLPLQAVIKCLDMEDRTSLAGTCRQLAAAVSAASPDTSLTVTPSTGWQGISKVLNTRTITCKTLRIQGVIAFQYAPSYSGNFQNHPKIPQELVDASPNNAFDVLLGPEQVTGCSFPGIQRVQIHVILDTCAFWIVTKAKIRPLRCLLRINIASCLPDLEELEIKYEPGLLADSADLHPIPYCSSLRKLTYIATERNGSPLQLPRKYHTAEDLRRQLPNIVALTVLPYFMSQDAKRQFEDCMNRMLNAWGSQLAELELNQIPANLQQCTSLQSLTLHTKGMMSILPLEGLPPSITSLTLDGCITEAQLQAILKLPALSSLSAAGMKEGLQQDWSQHPCTWQRLQLGTLPVASLGKLPLHSLKGQGCLTIKYLSLPKLREPGSAAEVMRAAQCISNANITIEGWHDWQCRDWEKDDVVHGHEADAKTAELLHAASSIVQPPDYYHHVHVSQYSQTLTALFEWLSPKLRSCRINFAAADMQPEFWQALQCCSHLERVELGFKNYLSHDQVKGIAFTLVQQAAEHLVTVTGRPVNLVLKPRARYWVEYNNDTPDDAPHANQEDTKWVERKLQQELPSTVSLQGFTWTDSELVISLKPMS